MIARFSGEDGRRRLISCLQRQTIIQGNEELATSFVSVIELKQFEPGDTLIRQDAVDTNLLFIVSGRVSIVVNGREVAIRGAGQHVGEMALIDTSARRAASVVAIEPTIVGLISEAEFSTRAENHPRLWRLIALELCERLRQRNGLVPLVNPRPVLFIGSSRESLSIAAELKSGLIHDDILVHLWNDNGIFEASKFPIEDLATQINTSDFAVLVLGPDDRVISRGTESDAPRDNVIFELGLFMGALTRQRTFIVAPRNYDIKIPTDILGLTPLLYQNGSQQDIPALIGPVCDDLRRIIQNMGSK
jgi:CRP/FNR family transcriptional regulator, cyclic AMP receptor protein